ncbi:hypothetical protein [Bartonella tamiae]|uniref:Uncharacterized protein n=1 Tax=Bartonella tamiae Th239 TaxID=1094558 RepID=J0ZK82_9HYPH|nr:hypothetical protein [Bartonella tamiae]EJF88753.1 hypothetical protein ME5_01304 [Bartonella tamiae Th239]EJF94997.1 hypothetical protein MEG_00578 [Bartonella tamiae Th307]
MSKNQTEIIGYITDMSKEMKIMANAARSPFLAYLLDMVSQEGQNILNVHQKDHNNH